jgi:hypothetical protein
MVRSCEIPWHRVTTSSVRLRRISESGYGYGLKGATNRPDSHSRDTAPNNTSEMLGLGSRALGTRKARPRFERGVFFRKSGIPFASEPVVKRFLVVPSANEIRVVRTFYLRNSEGACRVFATRHTAPK